MTDETLEETRLAFRRALLSVDRVSAGKLLAGADYSNGRIEFMEGILVPVLDRIGADWEKGDVALSQVYMSGRICEELVDRLSLPDESRWKNIPNTAITVFEDYHMLGKRLVSSMLRASGFDVNDYGRTELDSLVRRVMDDGIGILLISALMLPSALRIGKVRERLNASGHGHVRIVVGGAPFRFDPLLWREVGADAVGDNAAEAVKIISNLTGGEA